MNIRALIFHIQLAQYILNAANQVKKKLNDPIGEWVALEETIKLIQCLDDIAGTRRTMCHWPELLLLWIVYMQGG